jgi:4'-phosphopantetheinyl transferase
MALSQGLAFTLAAPTTVAATLDASCVHLWRLRYAASQRRAPLRHVLAAYLDIAEPELVLDAAERGKPHIALPASSSRLPARSRLEFNWSHSGDRALIAITRGLAVGVDIERLGKPLRARAIAHRFFDPAEAEALDSLPTDACNAAFTGLWCAKEAVLKASGVGLSFGLDRLAFTHATGRGWTLTRLDPALGEVGAWQLHGFAPEPGYRGALAWRGSARSVQAFELPPADHRT